MSRSVMSLLPSSPGVRVRCWPASSGRRRCAGLVASLLLAWVLPAGWAQERAPAPGEETKGSRMVDGLVLPFREVLLAAPVQKRLAELRVEDGEKIAAGQVLAVLESKLEELEMLRFAKVLEKREFENDAALKLAKDKFISKDEALEKSLELDIARIQHDSAKERFEMLHLRSPIDGVVVERLKEVGESVDENEPVFRLVAVDRVFVQFYLPSEDVFLLEDGEELEVVCPLLPEAERTRRGVVEYIAPVVDASSGLLRVRLLLDNADGRISAGWRVRVVLPESEPAS